MTRMIRSPSAFKQPSVRREIFHRFLDTLPDGQLRLPPKGANLLRIEKDKRAVADPPALAAGVGALGRDAHLGANPADGVVYLAEFICPEVVDVHAGRLRRAVEHSQHRVDAVLHIQVTLALLAISEHGQLRRVLAELVIKVVHVAMAVALAED